MRESSIAARIAVCTWLAVEFLATFADSHRQDCGRSGSEQSCFEDAKAILVLVFMLQFVLVIVKMYASFTMFDCDWVQGEECEPVFRLKEAVRKESS